MNETLLMHKPVIASEKEKKIKRIRKIDVRPGEIFAGLRLD